MVPEHQLQTNASDKVLLIKVYLLPEKIFRDKFLLCCMEELLELYVLLLKLEICSYKVAPL